MFGISPGGSSLGGGMPLGSFSLNGQTNEEPQQPLQPRPIATQSASLSDPPMCGDQIPVTVIVTQTEAPTFGVANVNGKDSIVVGVSLTFTFLDQKGKPVNAAVAEIVTDSVNQKVITADEPTFLDSQGRGSDLVLNSFGSIPISGNEASERAALNFLNADFTSKQTLTLFVVSPGGSVVRVMQQRTLTNMIRGAPSLEGGLIRGYTFTMDKPKIERIK